MFVDAHVHCVDLSNEEPLAKYSDIVLICVADDPRSSEKVVELSNQYPNITPCVGIHPWVAHEYRVNEALALLARYVDSGEVKCLGEVGLDRKFVPNTFEKQVELFNVFVKYAREYDLVLNIHAADAWVEVFNIVHKNDVNHVYFHWYTGPIELLHQIESVGYFIGANPAWRLQQKHRVVLERASLGNIITESDAPYKYRGLVMTPNLVKETVKYLADLKHVDPSNVERQVYSNLKRLFHGL